MLALNRRVKADINRFHSAYDHIWTGRGMSGEGGHDEYFRTILHAIHRKSWVVFDLRVTTREEPYHRNHHLSHVWGSEDHRKHGL